MSAIAHAVRWREPKQCLFRTVLFKDRDCRLIECPARNYYQYADTLYNKSYLNHTWCCVLFPRFSQRFQNSRLGRAEKTLFEVVDMLVSRGRNKSRTILPKLKDKR